MKGRKAHTFYDNRYTEANKINNMRKDCPKGNIIFADQKNNKITVNCSCGISITMTLNALIDANDALTEFHDLHVTQIK